MNVLFVCTGNTCRSAMAQGIAKKMIQSDPQRYGHIKVASAGTYSQEGDPASEYAQLVAKEHGIDLSNFVSQQVGSALLGEADLVLAMTGNHKMMLNTLNPEAMDKIFLLKEFELGENVNALNIEASKLMEQYGAVRENFVKSNQERLNELDHLNQTNPKKAEKLFNQLNEELYQQISGIDQRLKEIEIKLQQMEVSDPFGGNKRDYQHCYQELEKSIATVLEKLAVQEEA